MLSRLLKTFAIKNKVITFKNVYSNFISLIEIVEHKKHKIQFILLSFVLFKESSDD